MEKYVCNTCNYLTSRTANYKRHMISTKHLQKTSQCTNNSGLNNAIKTSNLTTPPHTKNTQNITNNKNIMI